MKLLALSLSLLLGAEPSQKDVWPGFRGFGAGVSPAAKVPLQWSPTENIGWKADLPGYGQSSPVVWQDKVFVTAVSGPQRDKGYVLAFDALTGKKLWSHEFEPTQKVKWSTMISRAAPTPQVDAQTLYAFFEGGDVLAFSHAGKLLWSRSLVKEYGEFQNGHGVGSSPAQTKDGLVILIDHRAPSYLIALDKKTGKNLWKTERPERGSWTSPIVTERGGREEVIVSSNGSVAGYDAASGQKLWEMEGLSGNTVPSATCAEDRIVIGSGVGRMGGDPQKASKSNCCLKLIDKDGKPSYELCWQAEKVHASFASPLIYRGHVYFVNQQGIAYCLDLQTGKERYLERLDGSCWASPIGVGDHVFFFTKDGATTVVKTGPAFAKVATNRLWETAAPTTEDGPGAKRGAGKGAGEAGEGNVDSVLYGVAAVEGAFFVRSGTRLFRIGKL